MRTLNNGFSFKPGSFSGQFRYAMVLAGFHAPHTWEMFTQVRKDGTRRVKLWRSDNVFNADQKQQEFLDYCFKMCFGSRYKGGYFMREPSYSAFKTSLCIILEGHEPLNLNG